jgi:hypothetical protein
MKLYNRKNRNKNKKNTWVFQSNILVNLIAVGIVRNSYEFRQNLT